MTLSRRAAKAPMRVGAPGTAGPSWTAATADSNEISVSVAGCGQLDLQPHARLLAAGPTSTGWMLSALMAVAELWLAVSFHFGSTTSCRGSEASSSADVHGVLRPRSPRARA